MWSFARSRSQWLLPIDDWCLWARASVIWASVALPSRLRLACPSLNEAPVSRDFVDIGSDTTALFTVVELAFATASAAAETSKGAAVVTHYASAFGASSVCGRLICLLRHRPGTGLGFHRNPRFGRLELELYLASHRYCTLLFPLAFSVHAVQTTHTPTAPADILDEHLLHFALLTPRILCQPSIERDFPTKNNHQSGYVLVSVKLETQNSTSLLARNMHTFF